MVESARIAKSVLTCWRKLSRLASSSLGCRSGSSLECSGASPAALSRVLEAWNILEAVMMVLPKSRIETFLSDGC